MSVKFLVFAASHRPNSYNRKLALAASTAATTAGAHIDFAEYAEFDMPLYNDHQADQNIIPDMAYTFLKRAQNADGLIIASPEYNWSYPGSLKNIIDWASRIDVDGLKNKTALLLCATPGSRGGIIGLDHLRSPLTALQLHVFNRAFPLGKCQSAFNEAGELQEEKQHTNLQTMVTDFVTFTHKLTNH